MQSGGVGTFNLGAGNKNMMQLNGPANTIDLLNLTGGLRFNGNAGNAGQVLKSNGAGASPSWGIGVDVYNNTDEVVANNSISIAEQTSADVPGLSKTITLATSAKVAVEFNAFVYSPPCAFCGKTSMDFIIVLDGNVTNRIRHEILNDNYITATGKRIFTLGPGTHTLSLLVNNLTGPAIKTGYFSPNYTSYLFVQTMPAQ
ncbi:hypothetical protein BH10BAC3_BH10BAC3_40020 [soil metagenome]